MHSSDTGEDSGGTVHQLFIDVKKANDSVRSVVHYSHRVLSTNETIQAD
jgi:hypothetical protein